MVERRRFRIHFLHDRRSIALRIAFKVYYRAVSKKHSWSWCFFIIKPLLFWVMVIKDELPYGLGAYVLFCLCSSLSFCYVHFATNLLFKKNKLSVVVTSWYISLTIFFTQRRFVLGYLFPIQIQKVQNQQ